MDVELSDEIRTAVEGHAHATDSSLAAAYEELLQRGLTHSAYPPSRPRNRIEEISGGSLDEVSYSPIADQQGLHAYTFRRLSPLEECLTFGVSLSISSTDEFTTAVTNIAPFLSRPDRAWFSISNYEGHWYGRGIDNFYTALTSPGDRYAADYAGKQHDNETALLFGALGEHGYIAIMSQPWLSERDEWDPDTDSMRRLAVQFLVEDYPLDTSVYEYIARQFNGELAAPSHAPCHSATLHGNTLVEPVALLTEDDDFLDGKTFVRGAIIPNPLYGSPQRQSEFEVSSQTQDTLSTDRRKYLRETAGSIKYLPLHFHGSNPTEERVTEIRLDSITITTGTVCSGFGHTNIEVAGTDVE